MIPDGGSTASLDTVPPGPITLPQSATLVSIPNDEVFLLCMRLAAVKPTDSSDTGHFHTRIGEFEAALLFCIELKPPTTCEPPRDTETGNQRRKRRRGSEQRHFPEKRRYLICSTMGSSAGRTSSNSAACCGALACKATTDVLFRSRMDRAGRGLLALGPGPLVRKYSATDIPALVPILRKNLLSVCLSRCLRYCDSSRDVLRIGGCGALARTYWVHAGGYGSPGARREAVIPAPKPMMRR
ncbi:hypothetical protein BJY52DRAFT_1419781 [Lactarius psammicola]|nr:hypothetical protein BJY52DRAFT_1419781 [Lactarius psammicola]